MADWFYVRSNQFVPRELRNDGPQVQKGSCRSGVPIRAEAFTQHCAFLHDVAGRSENTKEFHSPE
jgi:hypothetical protein